LADASDLAKRALDLSRAHKERGHEAWALKLQGDIALHQQNIEEAEQCYQRAFALSVELGMRPLQAHSHVGLGQVYEAMGLAEKAQFELSAAVRLYRSMEMALWLPKAEASLTRLIS
jgi:tetratricopeptide (TPR) repeat protein